MSEDAASQDGDFEDPIVIATCPECRCPYTEEKICEFRTEYLAGRSSPNAQDRQAITPPPERIPAPESVEQIGPSYGGTIPYRVIQARSADESHPNSEANTRAAIKINLEEQVSEIFVQGLDNVDPIHIVELNSHVQGWLAAEQAEGRVKEVCTLLVNRLDTS
ncbi:hypothetical protein FRC07_008116 [Ceratobasidium sp. 392]|nr:hypothetical protein FRC07_008116 [Ceratobasidium sp. 392]